MAQEPVGYLLDTSVLLETLRRNPAHAVIGWMESVEQDRFYISVITIGEIMASLEQVSDPDRRTELMRWVLTDMQSWFHGHILNLTPEVATFWGTLKAKIQDDFPAIAGLQSAFALKHNLHLVTREALNVPHLSIINPWEGS